MMAKGMVQNQEAFLNNIASSLGRERRTEQVVRPTWKKQPQYNVFKGETQDQLVERLKEQCQRIHTSFEMTSVELLPKVLEEIISKFDGERIINWKDDRFREYDLFSHRPFVLKSVPFSPKMSPQIHNNSP